MKKLKLNLDEIKIESFQTTELPKTIGTVNGNVTGTNAECEECAGGSYPTACYTTCPSLMRTCGDTYCGCDYTKGNTVCYLDTCGHAPNSDCI